MPLDGSVKSRIRGANRLTALKVAKLKEPGLYEDGAGLRLVVTPALTKRWVLRLTINGHRVERGLGVWPVVSLDDARKRAAPMRQAAKDGVDARKEHRRAARSKITFTMAFDDFFEIRRQNLSNVKHVQQWRNTMRDYVFPKIGNRPVADVTSGEVIDILKPIWFDKHETSTRVLQRVKATFDSAILRGTREKANPCIGVAQELGSCRRNGNHHKALPWRQVPAFILSIRDCAAAETTRLLFEFLILTVARSGEARGARWNEIDYSERTWTIPAFDPESGRRMKGGEPHIVPLSDKALELIDRARVWRVNDLIFPGSSGEQLSDNTLSKLMRDRRLAGTPHGFRSAFKDWAAEHGVRDEVSEAALAHTDGNKVRAAYLRTRFLDERRKVMSDWALLLSTQTFS